MPKVDKVVYNPNAAVLQELIRVVLTDGDDSISVTGNHATEPGPPDSQVAGGYLLSYVPDHGHLRLPRSDSTGSQLSRVEVDQVRP